MYRSHPPAPSRYAVYGVAAYCLWGLIPLYFKTVAAVAPTEILAHRALWSCVVLSVLVRMLGRRDELHRAMGSTRLVLALGTGAALIGANWLTFIYAVTSGQVLQSSLGYFISPLVAVLLGVMLLGERLRPRQSLAVALAVAGFLILALWVGKVPWLALILALTAAVHLLIRKLAPVDGLISLAVETLVMTPVALGYLGWLAARGELSGDSPGLFGLLMLAGPITTVPFLLFGAAAWRLRLSTMGILQYLTPSLQFVLAVGVFGEPFSMSQLASFACVWAAVGIYAVDSYRSTGPPQLEPIE